MCLLEDEDVYTVDIDEDITVVVIHVPRANYDQKPIYIKGNPYTGTYKRNFEGDYRCDKETVNAMIAMLTQVQTIMKYLIILVLKISILTLYMHIVIVLDIQMKDMFTTI